MDCCNDIKDTPTKGTLDIPLISTKTSLKTQNTKPSPKKIKQNSKYSKENESFMTMMKNNLVEGLPSSFTYGDYYACSMILKALVASTTNLNLSAATSYFSFYYGILMYSINTGIMESQSIIGCQAIARKNYKRANLLARQSVLTGLLYFGLFVLIPIPFLKQIFASIGVLPELLPEIMSLIVWTIPPMISRTINDNLKIFVQNQGFIRQLGISEFFVFIFFVAFSYYLIIKLELGAMGFGLGLLSYELSSLTVTIYFIKRKCMKQTLITSIPIFTEFKNFFLYASNVFLSKFWVHLIWDSMNLVIGFLNEKPQMAAMSLGFNVMYLNYCTARGLQAYNGIIINEFFGRLRIDKAKKFFVNTLRVMITLSVIISLVMVGASYVLMTTIDDQDTKDYFKEFVVILFFYSFMSTNYAYMYKIAVSLNKVNFLTSLQIFDLMSFLLGCYALFYLKWDFVGPITFFGLSLFFKWASIYFKVSDFKLWDKFSKKMIETESLAQSKAATTQGSTIQGKDDIFDDDLV